MFLFFFFFFLGNVFISQNHGTVDNEENQNSFPRHHGILSSHKCTFGLNSDIDMGIVKMWNGSRNSISFRIHCGFD